MGGTVLNRFKGGARRYTFLKSKKGCARWFNFLRRNFFWGRCYSKQSYSPPLDIKTFFAPQKSEPHCAPFKSIQNSSTHPTPHTPSTYQPITPASKTFFWLLKKVNRLVPLFGFSEKWTALCPFLAPQKSKPPRASGFTLISGLEVKNLKLP